MTLLRRTDDRQGTLDLFPFGADGLAVELRGAGLLVGVATAAATFAHLFTHSAKWVMHHLYGADGPVSAARNVPWWVVAPIIAATVMFAVFVAGAARRFGSGRTGLSHIAAAARGESDGPSIRATMVRSTGTWAMSTGLVSIGRESAIIEMGGGFGTAAGRHGRFSPSLAAGGIVAAFAAAYHAPIAGVLYVEEHLGVRHQRRAVLYTVVGALIGHVVSVRLLHGAPILPDTQGGRGDMIVLGLIALAPTVIASRGFFELRARLTVDRARRRWTRRLPVVVPFIALTALAVTFSRFAAGNGLEALQLAADEPMLSVAISMAVIRLIATTTSLGAGAPGGVILPTMSIAAGWALLTFELVEAAGVDLPGSRWDGMVVAMVIGVAVGIRSPLVAVFLVPEMLGDLSLVPIAAVTVLAAMTLDRGVGRALNTFARRVPSVVYDEDA
ncbi:MAG TPA: chloride channel protein [Ilumatobacter sp.]|nr:chloride channel protein [Ilumatobacter sp.]